jgi:S1-C subfamily serine protease
MSASLSELLPNLSDAIAARVAAATPLLVAVHGAKGRSLNAIAWRPEIVVTSEQALSERDTYTVTVPGGETIAATPGGRDPGTNVVILRTGKPIATPGPQPAADPRVGDLALVLGLGARAGPTAQLAVVSETGPAWHSEAGGRIDRLIRLDLRGGRASEGGLVVDAAGNALGMAAAGPRGQVLVIPFATIARTLDPLIAEGRIARGWLGVGLQPVMVPPSLRAAVGQEQGRMIVSIARGGPAEQAGLMPGDILLALDGQTDLGHRAIRACLGPESVGKPVAVRLLRGGLVQTATLTVTARPAG